VKTLVVYDSFFGNTEKIAQEVGRSFGRRGEVRTLRAKEAKEEALEGVEMLVVGSPTRKFRPTSDIMGFLKGLPSGTLAGVKAAAFDTRADLTTIKSPVLRFIVNTAGYAAKPIAARLKRLGADLSGTPEGFLVSDTEGPLKEGELERAGVWADHIG